MTPAQIYLAGYALGITNDKDSSHRYCFVSTIGWDNDKWQDILDAIVRAKALAAIYSKDTLDPENFPEINYGL